MNEQGAGIGAKIRELRLKRGMTQSQLAGDQITRNMLSLIESDKASPSVSTLCYLAERLEMPVGYFFLSDEGENRYRKFTVIDEMKEKYRARDYRGCISLCESLPENAADDEIAMILAISHLKSATESAQLLDLRSAEKSLGQAAFYASKSLYCDAAFGRALNYTAELFRAAPSDEISDALCDMGAAGEFVPFETVHYFDALRSVRAGNPPSFRLTPGTYGERHVTALGGRDAAKKLRELSLDPALPYFMQYRVLCDLEAAANEAEDLRLAYSSSRRKIELIDKMRF